MCTFSSGFENACCFLRVVFAILKKINSSYAPTFSAGVLFLEPSHAVDCCRFSKRRYYPQVLLRPDHSRRFSLLSAKILNLDAKCKCFGVYFLLSANLFFESANQADGRKDFGNS